MLLTVSVCGALGTPGCWFVKVRLVGLTLKAGGESPVPLKATVCVRRASAIGQRAGDRTYLRGSKDHADGADRAAANCVPQVLDTWNWALTEMAIEVSGKPPEFVSVTFSAAESWPSDVGGKGERCGVENVGGRSDSRSAQFHGLRARTVSEGQQAGGGAILRGRELHFQLADGVRGQAGCAAGVAVEDRTAE